MFTFPNTKQTSRYSQKSSGDCGFVALGGGSIVDSQAGFKPSGNHSQKQQVKGGAKRTTKAVAIHTRVASVRISQPGLGSVDNLLGRGRAVNSGGANPVTESRKARYRGVRGQGVSVDLSLCGEKAIYAGEAPLWAASTFYQAVAQQFAVMGMLLGVCIPAASVVGGSRPSVWSLREALGSPA
jgi:hypothetical protein